jgi:HlyD family secretion protein
MAAAAGEGRGGGDPRSGAPGRVWVLDGDKLKALPLTLGISDGAATEILSGDLKEGQEIVVGAIAPGTGRTPSPSAPGGTPRLRL